MSFSNRGQCVEPLYEVRIRRKIIPEASLKHNEYALTAMGHLKAGPIMIARSIPFFSVLLLLMGCSVQRIESSWALSSPTIDGNLDEWKGTSLVVFRDAQVSIAVGNDSSYLYLGGRIANTEIQRAVGQSGVVLWLNPDNRKEKDLEICFPASKAARTDLNRGGFWDGLSDEQKAAAQEELKEMGKGVLVINRRMVQSHVYKEGNAEGFAGVVVESQGLVSFEARVPLRIEKDFPEFAEMHPGTTVTIGVGHGETGRSLSGAPGYEGAPPTGKLGFPGRGGPPGNLPPGEIWLEVGLAQPL